MAVAKTVFADAGFFIALLNKHDQWHRSAKQAEALLTDDVCIVTSQMVLTEVLNGLSKYGDPIKSTVARYVDLLHDEVDVKEQTAEQFQSALTVYRERRDKDWGHTDCASFCIMWKENISEALSSDQHFVQAGFKILMQPAP